MSKISSTLEFIEKANIIHNNRFDYSKVEYKHSKQKVIIICKIHGEFLQIPNAHLRGIGCSKCSGKCKSDTNDFIEKSKKIHKDVYDYSHTIYVSARKKIEIICPIHGSFFQTPNAHLNGVECIKCGFIKTASSRRKSIEQFIKEAEKIHGHRYDYQKAIYINNNEKIEIVCKLHGSFWQSPHMHLHRDKCGCPKCRLSKGEQRIIAFLDQNNIKYEYQKTFNDCKNPKSNCKLKFDFYIPNKNILIEYDGEQHFTFGRNLGYYISTENDLENTKYRDKIKTDFAKQNGISLCRIKYTDQNKIESILNSLLL